MSTFIRLTDYKSSDEKEKGFFKPENRYEAKQDDFEKIPGNPIAYWVSEKIKKVFDNTNFIEYSISDGKNVTSDNDKFVRNIWEVDSTKIRTDLNSVYKWIEYSKGGSFRRWSGNIEHIIDWSEKTRNFYRKNKVSRIIPEYLWFKKGITWSLISSGDNYGFRFLNDKGTFDSGGLTIFLKDENDINFYLSLFNSKVAVLILKIVNPTYNLIIKDIRSLPIIFPQSEDKKQQIETLTEQNIDISKEEWNSRETSWDFESNGLLRFARNDDNGKIETAYYTYCTYWSEKFVTLHKNEEELNRLFIEIYELGDELTPHVALKDITILKQEANIVDGELVFNADEIMKQFISYGVGVMFGRYSLDSDGLVVANLNQDYPKDTTFEIDDDNVIPVLEDDYFSDDIASRVVSFVKTTFGAENLSENIAFIEKCLGKTIRAYMVKDFYEDHIKRYKKRPIYWMVASPKKGFMSLSYMHRYTNDLFARVQNNYLREYIAKLEGTKEILNQTLLSDTASSKDKKEADKKIKAIEVKLKELIAYDRDTMTHFAQNTVEIDLDDGVKVNYAKFKDILYPIKGME